MGSLDFLFQGTPPTQVTNSGQNTSNVPTWLQDYAQGILSEGAAVASQPYPQYGGPMVAGQTGMQTQAANTVSGLQGLYQPTINSAVNMATNSPNQAAFGTALGYMPTASGDIQNSIAPTAAMMNPYTKNVIQQAEQQGMNYWNNQLMPSINNQFTAAGQPMSSAAVNQETQQANLLTQQIQQTANSALANAYTNAQQAGLAGGSALGSLSQTAGGLGYEQGQLGLGGAGALGSLATTGQELGLKGASALDAAGQELQQNEQQNLTTGYNQFLQQQQYPYQQVGWLSSLMGNTIPGTTPGGTSTNQQQTVPSYYSSGQTPFSSLGGLASLFASGGARGGHFHRGHFRRGGRVSALALAA